MNRKCISHASKNRISFQLPPCAQKGGDPKMNQSNEEASDMFGGIRQKPRVLDFFTIDGATNANRMFS
jgi:hypothetical protein